MTLPRLVLSLVAAVLLLSYGCGDPCKTLTDRVCASGDAEMCRLWKEQGKTLPRQACAAALNNLDL